MTNLCVFISGVEIYLPVTSRCFDVAKLKSDTTPEIKD